MSKVSRLRPDDDVWDGVAERGAGRTWRDVVEASRRGFAVGVVDRLVASGRLSHVELDRTVLPRKTLSHRRRIGRLTPEQSDRLARVMHVLAAAEETFGARDKAARWLRRPSLALGGDAPIDLLDTTDGSRQVERLLGQIDHGIAA